MNTYRIASICENNNAYLHIDGAFGIYARCSPEYSHLARGLEMAHSITGTAGYSFLNKRVKCSQDVCNQCSPMF